MSDGSAPAFFLSYARAPVSDANKPVLRLFDDLTQHLIQLLALPPGQDPGFMDTALKTGAPWEQQLLRMVGTCQTFIALLSEPYLYRSEWCAMEWDLFSLRKVTVKKDIPSASPFSRAIVPVLWAPLQRELPKRVAAIQYFLPRSLPDHYLSLYQSEGLLGTMKVDPDAYTAITWKLAREIQVTYASYDVAPLTEESTVGLHRSFGGGL